jgi:hypothetical protein
MADEFVSETRRPDVTFNLAAALAPSALYVGPGEQLRISVNSSFPGAQVKISGRILLTTGQIVPFEYWVYPTADRAPNVYQFALPEGFLLGLRMKTLTAVATGRVFAIALLVKGDLLVANVLQQLTAGYIADYRELTWPIGGTDPPRAGPGWIRYIVGTDPAAGSEISETVPTNAYWRLQTVAFSLSTSATAANRSVNLRIDNGTTTVAYVIPGQLQIASLNRIYSYGAGFPLAAPLASYLLQPLPYGLILAPGWRIQTETDLLQAGDNFCAPLMSVEEWIEV